MLSGKEGHYSLREGYANDFAQCPEGGKERRREGGKEGKFINK
jgi:hypothetical protein